MISKALDLNFDVKKTSFFKISRKKSFFNKFFYLKAIFWSYKDLFSHSSSDIALGFSGGFFSKLKANRFEVMFSLFIFVLTIVGMFDELFDFNPVNKYKFRYNTTYIFKFNFRVKNIYIFIIENKLCTCNS